MKINAQQFARYAADPTAFRADLIVDVDGSARRFGDVIDPWQRDDFAAIDGALMRSAGRASRHDGPMRAYLERPRGHSKTTDLAVMCCWAMAFASRPMRGYCFAADAAQAGLLKDAMATLIRRNPWLGTILEVQRNLVANIAKGHPGEGGKLEIFTSDVASSYGILPDLVIADELTHWEGDGSLWHSIISSAAKRQNCFLCVISNAGFVDSWQWAVREAARTDEAWQFSRLDGPVASWMTEARLAEQRRMLPPVAFARLWLNQWSTGGGDALTEEDIAAAFNTDLRPLSYRLDGWEYVAGLDLGVSRDASAICVLGIRKRDSWEPDATIDHGKIRLVYTRRWQPNRHKGERVNLQDVENSLAALNGAFGFAQVAYDPWQAQHMAQRLALLELPMREVTSTSKNLQQIATVVIESFNDRRVELFDDADLRRDLRRLRVEERANNGFRLVSPRDETGHGDSATAFGYALLAASEIAGEQRGLATAYCGGEGHATWKDDWAARQREYQEEMQSLSGSSNNTRELIEGLFQLRRMSR